LRLLYQIKKKKKTDQCGGKHGRVVGCPSSVKVTNHVKGVGICSWEGKTR